MVPAITLNKISAILKDEGCKEVFLFGSHVTGRANKNSDIDIGVKGLKPSKFFSVFARLDSEIPEKLILLILMNRPHYLISCTA